MSFIINRVRINNRHFTLHYIVSKNMEKLHRRGYNVGALRRLPPTVGQLLCQNYAHIPHIPFKCKKETENADQQTAVYLSLR